MTLTHARLAAYAMPAFPLAALYFPVFVFLADFYATERGVALATIGVILLGVRVFDAVSDPLIGWASDRFRPPLGRRRFWLVLALPLTMLAAWRVFVPAEGADGWYLALWLTLLTAGWSLAMTPYFAWGAELSTDYAGRARVALWREAVGLCGTVTAALLFGAAGGGEGMARIGWFVLLVLPLAVALCVALVPEPRDYSNAAPRLTAVLSVLRGQPVFRRLLLAYLLNGAANGVAATLFVFFVSYRLDAPAMAGPLLVLYFLAAILAAPLWAPLAARYSKHRVWCWAMIVAGVVFAGTLALGSGDWIAFAVICGLTGAMLGADLALPSAIQADLVDIATADTGAQQTGAWFALWSVATKLALALSGAAVLVWLDWGGFAPETGGRALLSWLYGAGPIVLKMLAVALMWNFGHDAAAVARLRAQIEARLS